MFFNIEEYLTAGDVLVMNSTKVYPARLRGKKQTGGKVEVLLIGPHPASGHLPVTNRDWARYRKWGAPGLPEGRRPTSSAVGPLPLGRGEGEGAVWRALVRGSTKSVDILFPEGITATMKKSEHEGEWLLHFSTNSIRSYLDRHGEMPLPPYIKRPEVSGEDVERYQTVFAKTEGAVAAPTAGFHFTHELLDRLRRKGVELVELILHVGWGTFRPIRTELIEDHHMLPEYYSVSSPAAAVLNQAKSENRRIVAVGTTTVRTLETIVDATGRLQSGEGETRLFIYPGYSFKAVDALVTNFHLPDSTPLLLANAFYTDKRRIGVSEYGSIGVTPKPPYSDTPIPPFPLKSAYEAAIREGYRFYSYGDAMLLL